ncbi:MAG: signal peptidase I [Lachnospiraceae bacterium]
MDVKKRNYKKKSIWKNYKQRVVIKWIVDILIVLALAFLLTFLFGAGITVQENSMNPTIHSGDMVLMNRLAAKTGGIKKGSIIVYVSDEDEEACHVKRVIALPGDTIQIKDGLIMINGETYMEDLELPSIIDPGLASEPVKLGPSEYFVLGDNRNSSEDSRYADVGNISSDEIKGVVWFLLNPSERRGFVR